MLAALYTLRISHYAFVFCVACCAAYVVGCTLRVSIVRCALYIGCFVLRITFLRFTCYMLHFFPSCCVLYDIYYVLYGMRYLRVCCFGLCCVLGVWCSFCYICCTCCVLFLHVMSGICGMRHVVCHMPCAVSYILRFICCIPCSICGVVYVV